MKDHSLDSADAVRGSANRPALITGGAGFVGTNLAHRLLVSGRRVIVMDNLSRPGVERNAQWLVDAHGSEVQIEHGDIRDTNVLQRLVSQSAEIYHLAAQVAVTTSLCNPVEDFEINARGTLNLLEAIRLSDEPHPLLFTSTNKVYGALADVELSLHGRRWEPVHPSIRSYGVGEIRPLDFHSPYGCSKGSADQYVLDYAHVYNLPAVVLRMSCIYGPHQCGTEDQGWVAHFLIRSVEGEPIALYGDGNQVRDVLFVEDLMDAFEAAQNNIEKISGQAFNIGGGPQNTTSLLELLDLIERLHGVRPAFSIYDSRPGDQRYYVSDTRKFTAATGWKPHTSIQQGVGRLYDWLLCEPNIPQSPVEQNGHQLATNGRKTAASSRTDAAGVVITG